MGLGELARARRRLAAQGHPLLRRGRAYVERTNPTLSRLIGDAGEDVRILDVGCGRGLNLEMLSAGDRFRGVGLELDEEAAAAARARGLVVETGDIRHEPTRKRLLGAHGQFDVIVFADVLEHLVEPQEVLLGSLSLLAPGGRVLISIPNVAVWFQRLALLSGRFEYDDTGILDRTHLRFFTRSSFDRWLRTLGFRPRRWAVTGSLVPSVARFLRPLARERGAEMEPALGGAYRTYLRWVEPVDRTICSLWPSLLAYQLVVMADPPAD